MLRIYVDRKSGTISTELKGSIMLLRAEAVAAISTIAENLHTVTGESKDQIIDLLCIVAKQVSDEEV